MAIQDWFTGTEKGFFLDISDLSTLWQDEAKTTPVTGVGDPVRAIDDKSGQGNHFLIDSGNGSGVPTYQVDANGCPYLDLSGANILFVNASTGDITITTNIIAYQNSSVAEGADVDERLFDFAGVGSRVYMQIDYTIQAGGRFQGYTGFYPGTGLAPDYWDNSVINLWEMAYDPDGALDDTVDYYRDGEVDGLDGSVGNGNVQGSFTLFGQQGNPTGVPAQGRFVGMIIIDRALTAGERTEYTEYFNARIDGSYAAVQSPSGLIKDEDVPVVGATVDFFSMPSVLGARTFVERVITDAQGRATLTEVNYVNTNGYQGWGAWLDQVHTGTADSGTSTTLTHSGQGWTADQFSGSPLKFLLKITGGTNSGEERIITTNTTDTITVDRAFTAPIDNTSVYEIVELKDGITKYFPPQA